VRIAWLVPVAGARVSAADVVVVCVPAARHVRAVALAVVLGADVVRVALVVAEAAAQAGAVVVAAWGRLAGEEV
jgi:ABC-type tungstate transport system substrate-binding protein